MIKIIVRISHGNYMCIIHVIGRICLVRKYDGFSQLARKCENATIMTLEPYDMT